MTLTVVDDVEIQPDGGCHHIGRYAEGYRYAFKRGAADALRVAARRLPAECWDTLEQLIDEYAHDPDEVA